MTVSSECFAPPVCDVQRPEEGTGSPEIGVIAPELCCTTEAAGKPLNYRSSPNQLPQSVRSGISIIIIFKDPHLIQHEIKLRN